jgi:NAD+--asparagine ADP-ribosyltransferase
MAYVSQELKAKLAPKIKAICKKYGVKASLAVRHHSTLVLNIKEGKVDFITDYNECNHNSPRFEPATGSIQVNPYHYKSHFQGDAYHFLSEVIPEMNAGNWDKSDIQSDYFNVGWYIDVNIGKWNKPYQVAA